MLDIGIEMSSDLLDDPGLAVAAVEGALLDLGGEFEAAVGGLEGLAEDGADVVGLLAMVLLLSGRHDVPELALVSLVVGLDGGLVVRVVVVRPHVLAVGHALNLVLGPSCSKTKR